MLRALESASRDITHETGVGYELLPALCSAHHTPDRGYGLLRTLGSASCDTSHETGGTICYVHWALHRGISQKKQGYDLLLALGSASCEITHEIGSTIWYVRWLLHFVISPTKERGLRFVTGIGFCILRYHKRDKGYDLLRALGSASCDITHDTGGTICYGHWALGPVISHTRQGVQQAFGAASGNTTHETGG